MDSLLIALGTTKNTFVDAATECLATESLGDCVPSDRVPSDPVPREANF